LPTNYNRSVLVTEETAATILGVSVSWLQKGRIYGWGPKYRQIGRKVLYDLHDLEKYLADRRRDPERDLRPRLKGVSRDNVPYPGS
jgi:hypothetical protein